MTLEFSFGLTIMRPNPFNNQLPLIPDLGLPHPSLHCPLHLPPHPQCSVPPPAQSSHRGLSITGKTAVSASLVPGAVPGLWLRLFADMN